MEWSYWYCYFDRAMGVESNNPTNATTVGHKAG